MLPDEFVLFGQYGRKDRAGEGIAVYLSDSNLPASFPADLPLLKSLSQQGQLVGENSFVAQLLSLALLP